MRSDLGRPRARLAAAATLVLLAACGSPPQASRAPASPTVIAEVPTGMGPILLAAGPDAIWLELHREDLVARIDPRSNEQAERTDIAIHCGLAAEDDVAWATYFRSGLVTRFDARTGDVLDAWDVSGDTCGLAIDGDRAWVGIPTDGDLVELTPGEPEPTRTIHVAPGLGVVVAVGDSLWVTSENAGGTVYRVNGDGAVTKIGDFPGASSIHYLFDAIWVASRDGGGRVWKLDPDDGSILLETTVGRPSGLVADDVSIWITGWGGSLIEIDPQSGELVSEHPLDYALLGPPIIAFDSLWTAALDENLVLRIDLGR